MTTRFEKLIHSMLCNKIGQLVAKNKNNPLLVQLLLEIAREYECEVNTE